MVLIDIRKAPIAGEGTIFQGDRIPAASGIMAIIQPALPPDVLYLLAITGNAEFENFHYIQWIAFHQDQPGRLDRHIGATANGEPTFARIRAGPSLTPSPTMPTVLPCPCNSIILCYGEFFRLLRI